MSTEKKMAGRPRKEGATSQLMEIALQLVRSEGYEHVTMNTIADTAGVSRQTVYRRWATKADLVMDALLEYAGTFKSANEANLRTTLAGYLKELFRGLQVDGATVRSLIAAAQIDNEFGRHFQERFVTPRDNAVKSILELRIQSGEIKQGADLDLACELIHGAFWYRLLLNRPLDETFADDLAESVIGSILAK
ncbi:TetR/AcrR family transcriptional regulator (plasmid) [Agrobacterium radiobacter]|uniref:Transcriptional regulator, TetR family n=1 Tax=Agrobacterium tumefaciens str. B6 TaxID=1183423 RepID=A0A822VE13_AGRTU|nr:TetR/AcrR family transcriptional regulator [Agrobacterium tumefaciens]NTA08335.1 TetR/AcrR family transcriptional regulator [Agrobacterium tumefaciens]NTB16157.1 TetR/AcrR family transcriptional regulator [Agrobacterium tumefaciens]CVI25384.1 Transcriptional regulator, TetR family [Agrobacterium tumefaciens str. B6]